MPRVVFGGSDRQYMAVPGSAVGLVGIRLKNAKRERSVEELDHGLRTI